MSERGSRPAISPWVWVAAFLVAGTVLAIAYKTLRSVPPPSTSAHLERISEVPPFELRDQNNRSVTRDSLKGKVWVAHFVFTRCKGPCPLTTSRMQELDTKLKKVRKDVQLVSFTVDPEYDTPSVLKDYAALVGASDGWTFLTGQPSSMQDLIVKGLLQPIAKEPDGTPAHSTRLVIVDREGWLRGYQDGIDPEVVQKLMVDLGEILREPATAPSR